MTEFRALLDFPPAPRLNVEQERKGLVAFMRAL